MTKRLTSAQLTRRATLARARENAIAARVPSTTTTVRKRSLRKFAYNSYSFTGVGGASTVFGIQASEASVKYLAGDLTDATVLAKLGLRAPGSLTDPAAPKPKGFKPARVSIMVGATAPTASNTPWNTRVIKYSAATGGTAQAHYTSPICADTTTTFTEVNDKATALYIALLARGATNGLGELDYARFYLYPEEFINSKN
jgi:hypothetical protein